jgi:hypothetical protein
MNSRLAEKLLRPRDGSGALCFKASVRHNVTKADTDTICIGA